MYTVIFIDNKKINFFVINKKGRIVLSGDKHKDTWDHTIVDLKSIEVGKPITLEFKGKKEDNFINGKKTNLNYNTLEIYKYDSFMSLNFDIKTKELSAQFKLIVESGETT